MKHCLLELCRFSQVPAVCCRVLLGSHQTARLVLSFLLASCVMLPALCAQESGDLILEGVTKADESKMVAGKLFTLRASVRSVSDQPVEALLVANLVDQKTIQGAAEVRLLPGRSKQFDVTLQLPSKLPPGQDRVPIEVKLVRIVNGTETLLAFEGNVMSRKLDFKIDRLPGQVAMAIPREEPAKAYWEWPNYDAYSTYEMIVAGRISFANTRSVVSFDNQSLPIDHVTWQQIDTVVVAQQERLEDAANVEVLRRFMQDGGRLWIMLDRVSCESIRPLLGMGQACEEVDTVQLSQFKVDLASKALSLAEEDRTVQLPETVAFRRVIQQGGSVSHSIDGWPAAIKMPVGYGELVLTTLDSRAWIQPRKSDPGNTRDVQSAFQLRPWATTFGSGTNEVRQAKPAVATSEFSGSLIGNPVMPRNLVMAVLLGFVLTMSLVGLWRLRIGELSRFGIYAPVLAVIVACGLGVASTWNRSGIPETNASLQLAQVAENGRTVHVREFGSVYLSGEKNMSMDSTFNGSSRVGESIISGAARLQRDSGEVAWSLTNESWPTGVWSYESDYVAPVENATAIASLSETGMSIQLPKQFSESFEDPIVSFAPGSPMLANFASGKVTCDGSLMAEGDRWLTQVFIDNERKRRLQAYRSFFTTEAAVLPRRTLFGWSTLIEGPKWNVSLERKGSALVGLPISLEPPEIDQDILIPPGLVFLQSGGGRIGKTSAFDDRRGAWKPDLSIAARADLQIVLPQEVQPFAASSVEINLDMEAPHRVVRLLTIVAGQEVEIVRLDGPSIPWSGTIDDPEILNGMREGKLDLILEVGERTDTESVSSTTVVTWNVDSLRASVRGKRVAQ